MKKLREAPNDRHIDALLISIGGNDLGFADLVARCILDRNCSKDKRALKQLRDGLLFGNLSQYKNRDYRKILCFVPTLII